jgi:arsenite oxidase large subunit
VFMDGYHLNAEGGEFVTYARLRAMGTNGFQEPAVGYVEPGARGESDASPRIGEGQQRGIVSPPEGATAASPAPAATGIVGTKRLYADGRFGTEDGKAAFMAAQWRGLQAPGKEEQKARFPFLVNNGRANHVWQSAYLDVENELVMDRWPYPYIEMHAEDMAELGVGAGDLVEVYNDAGSTQAMVQPSEGVRRKETFMLFAYPTGVQGNVVNAGVNELVIPNYKQTWASIRKLADAPAAVGHLSFKTWEYRAG